MQIDRNNPLPLHSQITQYLKQQFSEGKWKVGDPFPTDKQLMEQFGVSITTVRQALSELVREGLIERRAGKGTFVIKTAQENLDKLRGFFEEMHAQGLKPSAEILNLSEVNVNSALLIKYPQIAIFNANQLFRIDKIQKANDLPLTYIQTFLPLAEGRKLATYDLVSHGIYEWLENELGIKIVRAEQIITAAAAGRKEAEILGVKIGSPLLVTQRIMFTEGDRPIEVHYNYARPDRYKFRVEMYRNGASKNEGIFF
ncbi:GntR family transcriptional regulator [Neomoorella humiferrea]|uniref:HTH-type transcriptional repressor YvoA n=1 Tax=Neomoorella humiferrea TaxID=676965 RepID=A0A2T0ANY4_9FIRM|nr:GntR family transcriptional regulator [Moorella humiferrea]PRR70727.1 HTH-type transcriptional repressor YvoA [Moorella humiferrea]